MRTEHLNEPLDLITASPAVRALAAALDAGGHAVATGVAGSSTSFVAAAAARITDRPVLLVVAHIDDADEALDEVTAAGVPALRLPALEVLPGETNVSPDLFAERLSVVRQALLERGVRGQGSAGHHPHPLTS